MMLCALLCLLLAVARCDGSSTCEDLGFTGHNLCSDCKQLSEMVKDQELTDDCLRCCTEQATSDQKYTKAVLEVCHYRLSSIPHVEEFVKKKAALIKGLRVVDRWGAPPRIVLSKGKAQESVRIDSWKTEQIIEFLKDKLEAAAPGS